MRPIVSEFAFNVFARIASARRKPHQATLFIFSVFTVPEVIEGVHLRNFKKVVHGSRRRDAPFECATIPRIGTRNIVAFPARHNVHDEQQHRQRDDERSHGFKTVHQFPAVTRAVGIGAARHALEPNDMHWEKGEVEADEQQPEPDLAHLFA